MRGFKANQSRPLDGRSREAWRRFRTTRNFASPDARVAERDRKAAVRSHLADRPGDGAQRGQVTWPQGERSRQHFKSVLSRVVWPTIAVMLAVAKSPVTPSSARCSP